MGRCRARVGAYFSICIHKKDIAVLKLIQNYFDGVGSLTKASQDTIHYRVASLRDLTNVIIPHFEKYPRAGARLPAAYARRPEV
jgi:hypothetical protein